MNGRSTPNVPYRAKDKDKLDKERRRSTTSTASSLSAFKTTRPLVVLFILATGVFLLLLHHGAQSTTVYARERDLVVHPPAHHPNFDFDSHVTTPAGVEDEEEESHEAELEVAGGNEDSEDEGDAMMPEHEHGGDEDELESESEAEDVEYEEDDQIALRLHPSLRHPTSDAPSARPYLPFTCDACSTLSPSHPVPPTCAKYKHSQGGRTASPFDPAILDRSLLFPGSGEEVRRVLRRAAKSSLYGGRRAREGVDTPLSKYEDEDPFRILVLGGSVSNCRGVDPKSSCWHAHLLRWFQENLPMEGDHDFVPRPPSQPRATTPDGPTRLAKPGGKQLAKRAVKIVHLPGPGEAVQKPPSRTVKKGKSKSKGGKKSKTKTKGRGGQPVTRLINASKSATGSAFFAYCFDEELTMRRKNIEWGKGPDLVVLEFGVNDVWPTGDVATQDFEKLLRKIRAMPSSPAIIILEAASLLLAQTTSFTANAEYLHLPAAQFYDVPVLSAKHSLFGPTPALLPESNLKIEDLFLPDLHHPNDRGHALLGDILISYIEQESCKVQSEILDTANTRIRQTKSTLLSVEPETDVPRRKDEQVLPLPHRSLFHPFGDMDASYELPEPRCIQVGNSKTTLQPLRNKGWTKFAWARDKQYLVAEKPGSSVTFEVEVGPGGQVLADWLHSRFYDLGDVVVYLDDDKAKGKTIAGYWHLGWSIGVPTAVFEDVEAGPHTVTFELLGSSSSSNPSHKTNFRLIGLITT